MFSSNVLIHPEKAGWGRGGGGGKPRPTKLSQKANFRFRSSPLCNIGTVKLTHVTGLGQGGQDQVCQVLCPNLLSTPSA